MSELTINPMFLRISRSIGNIVIYERDGKTYTRVKGKRTAPPTQAQADVKNTFTRLSADWKSADIMVKSSWYRSDGKKRNGFPRYMKANFNNERDGKPVDLFDSAGEIMPPSFTAAPGAAGEIVCSFIIPQGETGRHIHFYAKKRSGGISEGRFMRFSPEASSTNAFTLSGLEPGAEYFVYAALSDSTCNDSSIVSASVSAITSAGK